ncbi:MAG: hypothetical protein ACPL4I_12785 [Bacteroidota bacterium]
MSKVEEYASRLERHEKDKARKAEVFTPSDILADSATKRTVYVPEIDRIVEYVPLSLKDLEEINRAKTDQERAARTLWKMLSKANSEWTLERVEALPLEVAVAIIRRITPPLTPTQTQLEGGYDQTRQPSYTA